MYKIIIQDLLSSFLFSISYPEWAKTIREGILEDQWRNSLGRNQLDLILIRMIFKLNSDIFKKWSIYTLPWTEMLYRLIFSKIASSFSCFVGSNDLSRFMTASIIIYKKDIGINSLNLIFFYYFPYLLFSKLLIDLFFVGFNNY